MKTIYDLAEEIRRCTACPLWKGRTLAVPGEGKGKIMFVGGAPTVEEDRQGLPFVGKSGKFLDEMLEIAGLKREDVFFTGIVKCHPPENRRPSIEEVKTCKEKWLEKQIEVLKPKLVVILGRVALKGLLGQGNLKEIHGNVITEKGLKFFIAYHPAEGMRFPVIKKKMEIDFKKVRKLI